VYAGATGCILGAAGLAHLGAAPAAVAGSPRETLTPDDRQAADPAGVSSVSVSRPWVALTFDDGPDPDYTPAVLDILAGAGAKATFFVVGSNATAYPQLVARIRGEGHALANHTQNHRWLNALDEREVRAEMTLGATHVTGAGARLFRPPRGCTSPTVARVGQELRLRSVFWSDCVEAHFHLGPKGAGRRVGYYASAGSIILTHDGGRVRGPNPQQVDRSRSVEALPHLLAKLRQRGLVPVTMPTLLAAGRPS